MRVLHLANSYFFAGRLLAGKLAGLQALGYLVEVAAPPPTGRPPLFPARSTHCPWRAASAQGLTLPRFAPASSCCAAADTTPCTPTAPKRG